MTMRKYEIRSVDGPVHFIGRQLAQKRGRVELPDGTPARMTVTVYSTTEGEGFIREDIALGGRTFTFVHRIHPGTSPGWDTPDSMPAGPDLLDETWDLACRVDNRLRPVRKWIITNDYEEFRIQKGDGTYLVVRAGAIPMT